MWFSSFLWNTGPALFPLNGAWEFKRFCMTSQICFVDLERAFDRFPWEWSRAGSLLRAICPRLHAEKEVGDISLDMFLVRVGLQQGGPVLPVQFITFTDRISRHSQGPEGSNFSISRFNPTLSKLRFSTCSFMPRLTACSGVVHSQTQSDWD